MRTATSGAAALAASSMLLLAACGSADATSPSAGSDPVSVVASTDVYGAIASAIGGDGVDVTSIIDDPSADPHSFEVSTRTQLTVSEADVIIENGGGYDDFMDTLISSTDTDATVLNAVDISGKEADAETAGEELNEHVWYDFETVGQVVDAIAAALGDADPDDADTYTARAAEFHEQLDGLVSDEDSARATTEGAGVAITEPVPGYLLDALGAVNETPEEFSEAIEEGGDVSPAVLQETLDLFSGGQVQALVYNEQTTGPETEQVLTAAEAAGVAVVPVTETLPDGEDYITWMQTNVDAVVDALSS